jgi:valyl-tRNA synthetase
MSKSKGNIIDPLDLIDKYGCDALRFTLTAMAAQGRDIKMSEARVEGYRNFATKLWNATRYALMNECRPDPAFDPSRAKDPVNRWIVGRLVLAAKILEEAIGEYRYNEAANALYHFVWGEFCDWYLEFTKPVLLGADEAAKSETRATTAWVLGRAMHLMHPIMPFITEELWDQIAGEAPDLIASSWPDLSTDLIDRTAMGDLDWVTRLVGQVRALRTETNVPAGASVSLLLRDASPETLRRARQFGELIRRLARAERIEALAGEAPRNSAQIVIDEATILMPPGMSTSTRSGAAAEGLQAQADAGKIERN